MNRVLSALLLVVAAATAQDNSDSKVRLKRAAFENGAVVLDLRIEAGWHIYSAFSEGENAGSATKIDFEKPFESGGPIVEPKPIHHKKNYTDPDTKEILYTEEYDKHEGDITLKVPVKGSAAGPVKGSIKVIACDANMCLPVGYVKFSAQPSAQAPTNGDGGPNIGTQSPPASAPPESRSTSRLSRKVVKDPKRLGKFKEGDPVKVVEISYPDPITSDRFDVRIEMEIGPDYHIYGLKNSGTGIATSFTFAKGDGPVTLARNGEGKSDPEPKKIRKEFEDYDYYDRRVTFDIPVRAALDAGTAPLGEKPFTFKLTAEYQTCTMAYCLLPAEAQFELSATASLGPAFVTATDKGAGPDVVKAAPECALLEAVVSTEPPTLEPGKTGTIVARVKRVDCKPLAALEGARIDLGQGTNLFVEGPTSASADPDGLVTLRLPIRVADEAADGSIPISGRVTIGASAAEFSGKVRVLAPLLGFLLIAAGAALFALLTPCVFPMIPVTISIFTKQAEAGAHSPAKLGFVYCLGIVVSFTAIGAAFTGLLGGDAANVFAQHWITQLLIAALFVFFALSLLGMFDLAVPAPIMAMVERTTTRRMEISSTGKGGEITVLLMGLLFAITTFTCTAPFIGGLLAGAAASGQWTRPVLGMLVFSTILAVPFFFLALFPSQIKKLPKAGGWLNETKVVMGFIELSAAVKFLNAADLSLGWDFFTRNVCLAVWIAIFGMTGLYLIGVFRMPKDMPRQKTGVIAAVMAILFLTTAIYLTTGLNGRPLSTFVEGWLPPPEEHYLAQRERMESEPGTRTGYAQRFKEDYEGALAEAKRLNVPLFVDFTGFT